MPRALEIPFGYGDVLSITGGGQKVVIWLKDATGVIRGLLIDVTDPANPQLARDEIVIQRRTEGQVRKKKLPPVGHPLPSNLPGAAPRPAAAGPAPRPAAPVPSPRPPIANPAPRPAPGSSSR